MDRNNVKDELTQVLNITSRAAIEKRPLTVEETVGLFVFFFCTASCKFLGFLYGSD